MTLSENSKIVASPDQVSCDLGGEAVLLHLGSGLYYSLDSLGARIWSCIQAPKTFAEVRDALLAGYDVEAGRCDADLRKFLGELAAHGLIRVETPPCAPSESC